MSGGGGTIFLGAFFLGSYFQGVIFWEGAIFLADFSRYRLFIHNMLHHIVILRVEPCSLPRTNKAMNKSLRCTCFKQFLNNRSLMHNMLHRCPEICPRESRKPLTIITQHSILDVAAALDPSLLMSQKTPV